MRRTGMVKAALMCVAFVLAAALPEARAAGGDAGHLEMIAKKSRSDLAVEKALTWLAGQQDPRSGAFNGPLPNTYTGLSCIALMAAGQQQGRSRYGENLRKGVLFLVDSARRSDWYLGAEGNGNMYAHGIASLALCEAYGTMEDEQDNLKIKDALDHVIGVILNTQVKRSGIHRGGWRYTPTSTDADLSISVWQILVLRSAQNCRLRVPEDAVKEAGDYVRSVFCEQAGAFTYQGSAAGNTPAMNGAGIVAMQVLGLNKDPGDALKIASSARVLLSCDPTVGGHYWYQNYYLATAANMMGGVYRDQTLTRIENSILGLQQADGQFSQHTDNLDGVYSTAFAVICLSVRFQYLPIYQE